MAWCVCQDPGLDDSHSITEVEIQGLRDGQSFMWQWKVLKVFQEVDLEVLAILHMTSTDQNLNLWELYCNNLSKSIYIF